MSDVNSSQNPPSSQPHPGAKIAYEFIKGIPFYQMNNIRREFVRRAAEGDEWATLCIDTLNAVQGKLPMSERDLMGTYILIMETDIKP